MNTILIVVDTLRADHLGCYGYFRKTSPVIDDDIPTLAEIIWRNGGHTTVAFDNLINFRSHMTQFVRGYEYHINVSRNPFRNEARGYAKVIAELRIVDKCQKGG